MVTPSDEAGLAAQVAGIQATLIEHGKRFDRVEDKIEAVGDRIANRLDTVYPRLAAIEVDINNQKNQIDAIKKAHDELKRMIWGASIGIGTALIGLFGALISA